MLQGAGRRLAAAGQAELAEQNFAELLGRAEVERFAGDPVGLFFIPGGLGGEVGRQAGQHRTVDQDALALHGGKDGRQGALERLIDGDAVFRCQPRLEDEPQAQGDVGVLGGVSRGAVERHQVEGDLRLAGAGDLLEGNRLVVEMAAGQLVHAVAAEP